LSPEPVGHEVVVSPSLVTLAVRYTDRGVPALPVAIHQKPDGRLAKRPLVNARGFRNAGSTACEVRRLFQAVRHVNAPVGEGHDLGTDEMLGVGLWLGPAGLFALDVDVKGDEHGDDELDALEDQYGKLPDSVRVVTASNGSHIWLRKPDGYHVGSTTLAKGIDVRGDNGFVVAAGTETPWGVWAFDGPDFLDGATVADAPQWVLDRLAERTVATGDRDVQPAAELKVDKLPTKLRRLVNEEPVVGTRSDRIYHFTCVGLEHGLDDATILAALSHFPPAVDKGDVVRHGQRAIAHARTKDVASGATGASASAFDHGPTQPVDNFDTGDIDCGALFDDTYNFIRRFVVCPEPALVAATLFVAHTHAFDAADLTPRLSIRSAEPESGKTRFLEVLKLIVRDPLFAVGISDAALFRVVRERYRTVLHDEIDTVFGPKARDREDLRALLNAGYERGATVPRCVGEGAGLKVQEFPVFTPVVLAGLGKLPDTLESRSIVVHMKPRTAEEKVSRFWRRKIKPEADRLRARWEAFAKLHTEGLADAEPQLPEELSDREQEISEPLLAIADLAGPGWAERARAAVKELFAARGDDERSIGRRLLADIRGVFDDPDRDDPEDDVKGQAITSGDLASALAAIEGAPWAEWGKDNGAISATRVARMLGRFGIRPRQHKIGGHKIRGYLRSDFEDAWRRQLRLPGQSGTDAKVVPPNPNKGNGGTTSRSVPLSEGRGIDSRLAP
jgi:Protein of unknown function (DUF3631)/Bifunctional DNA primase/polymerase, N-terminal